MYWKTYLQSILILVLVFIFSLYQIYYTDDFNFRFSFLLSSFIVFFIIGTIFFVKGKSNSRSILKIYTTTGVAYYKPQEFEQYNLLYKAFTKYFEKYLPEGNEYDLMYDKNPDLPAYKWMLAAVPLLFIFHMFIEGFMGGYFIFWLVIFLYNLIGGFIAYSSSHKTISIKNRNHFSIIHWTYELNEFYKGSKMKTMTYKMSELTIEPLTKEKFQIEFPNQRKDSIFNLKESGYYKFDYRYRDITFLMVAYLNDLSEQQKMELQATKNNIDLN